MSSFTGDDVPPSAFCMTNIGEWDKFRNIDMDKEVILLLLFMKTFSISLKVSVIEEDELNQFPVFGNYH